MLGNIIGGFIVIMVGVMLIPTIVQEIDNVMNCSNNTTSTNVSNEKPYAEPIGTTDSFGGGGAGQFGGYDGKVHKSWASNYAIIKTDTAYTGICIDSATVSPAMLSMLKLMPLIFGLTIMVIAISIVRNALSDGGMI